MNILLGILSLYLIFFMWAFVTWGFFLAVMKLKDCQGSLSKLAYDMASIIYAIGVVLDSGLQLQATYVFWDIPREWLFSGRIKRLQYRQNWQGNLARWFRDTWLDPVDPGHCD